MKSNIFMGALAVIVVAGFFALLFILAYTNIPKENKDLLNMLLGAWLTAFANVIGYYFGSSKGSTDKDKTINDMMNGKENKDTH